MSWQLESTEHPIDGPTPEFVRWALEQPCSLRTNANWKNAEQTERQLRPLRAYSQAAEEGRVFEGVCVERSFNGTGTLESNVKGFRASEVLASYGGPVKVESACCNCPANRLTTSRELAGCYGWFEVESQGDEFHQVVEDAIAHFGLASTMQKAFPSTRPRWYGFWMDSPLTRLQTQLLGQLFQAVLETRLEFMNSLNHVCRGLALSHDRKLPFHALFNPRGFASGRGWTVVAHCPRCKAEMSHSQRTCRICGRTGKTTAPRVRHKIGSRPYWPIERFMGHAGAKSFLHRYSRHLKESNRAGLAQKV